MPMLPAGPRGPTSCAVRLRAQREVIAQKWLQRVRREIASADKQPEPALRDSIPSILDALADVLERASDSTAVHELFARHAEARIDWTDYGIDEFIREYAILRKVLFSVLEQGQELSSEERDRVLEFIDEGIRLGSARFADSRRFHERLELQYLKLIEHLIVESSNAGTVAAGLERLLEVVCNDLGAEAAAFFLYGEETLDLALSAAAGRSRTLADVYRGALALSGARVTAPGRTGAVNVVNTTELDPATKDTLNKIGICWLVLVRVISRDRVPGTLCIGFREKNQFGAIELRLLETLGDRLALILASLQLQDQSTAALERARRQNDMLEAERNKMEDERKHRDHLIAAISHDLKNPLSTVRVGAELIRSGAPTPEGTERLADQILKNVSRSDRMIQDLLDSQRVRAGKRLPLDITGYKMNELVDAVLEDMRRLHGERFALRAEPEVAGYWSWEAMRRVVENLVGNAVKYSPPDSPITLSLSADGGKHMRLSVHNEGHALSEEEQARIFAPFERGKSAERSAQRGWGIGLTLVQGIVQAHGGTVTVESTPTGGMTFTVINPMDSRPFEQLTLRS
jgi:signal transduction histidine kinase